MRALLIGWYGSNRQGFRLPKLIVGGQGVLYERLKVANARDDMNMLPQWREALE
ncbi:MAG: hypothetical protein WD886_12400 [Burkholderiales bacterium]